MEQRRVGHAAREHAVDRQAVPGARARRQRHAPALGLQPEQPAPGRRDADRARRRRSRARRRRGPRRPPPRCRRWSRRARAGRSHGLRVTPNVARLGERPQRQLGHVGLADDHRARLAQAAHDLGVRARGLAVGVGAERGHLAGDVDVVLDRDRHAQQRALAAPAPRARRRPGRLRAARARRTRRGRRSAAGRGARSARGTARRARARRPRRRRSARPGGRSRRRRGRWRPSAAQSSETRRHRRLRRSYASRQRRHGALPANRAKGEHPMSYPVTFEADYVERRSRLTAFFRLILAIPVAIVLYMYAIVAFDRDRDRVVRDRDHRPLPAGPVRLRRGLHALPGARSPRTRPCCATPTRRSAARRGPRLPGAHALRRAARAATAA